MTVQIYRGNQFIVKWGEVDLMPGRNKDEFLSIDQLGDDPIQSDSDIDGNTIIWSNVDNRHSVTLTLRQESPVNDLLSHWINIAQFGDLGTAVKPLVVKDPNGTTNIFDQNCVIAKRPTSAFGEKPGTRQWMFIGTNTDRIDGGSNIVVGN